MLYLLHKFVLLQPKTLTCATESVQVGVVWYRFWQGKELQDHLTIIPLPSFVNCLVNSDKNFHLVNSLLEVFSF